MTRLEEIKSRAENATPGPWSYENILRILFHGPSPGSDTLNHENDAMHMAHSREDIPWLVAEIERMKSALVQIIDDPGFEIEGNEAAVALRMNLIAHKALRPDGEKK